MTGLTMDVDGAVQLQATTAEAIRGLESLDMDEVGRIVALRGSSNAPKLTGTLSRSIHATTSGPLEVDVGSDLDYAAVTEFGGGNNISAQPYLRPALLDSTDAVLAQVGREVADEVSKIHGK